MNETIKTIMERYSCRDFADTPLTDKQIKALVDAALAAPSALNRQPWHIIVITDKTLIEELDAEGMSILRAAEDQSGYERIKSRGGKIFYNAPCMIIAASDGSDYTVMDCGILSQNVTLAAHSLGLGSVICGMAGVPLNGPRGDELKKRLQFPDGYGFGIAVLVGTAKTGKESHELDKNKVTYFLCARSETRELIESAQTEADKILNELKAFLIGDIGIRIYSVQHPTGYSIAGDLTVNGKICKSYDPVSLLFLDLNEIMLKKLVEERIERENTE